MVSAEGRKRNARRIQNPADTVSGVCQIFDYRSKAARRLFLGSGGGLRAGASAVAGELLLLGGFDHGDECLDLAERFGAAPHEDPVNMPVAALKGAAFEVVDGFAEHKGAGDEVTTDERLTADVDGLVE